MAAGGALALGLRPGRGRGLWQASCNRSAAASRGTLWAQHREWPVFQLFLRWALSHGPCTLAGDSGGVEDRSGTKARGITDGICLQYQHPFVTPKNRQRGRTRTRRPLSHSVASHSMLETPLPSPFLLSLSPSSSPLPNSPSVWPPPPPTAACLSFPPRRSMDPYNSMPPGSEERWAGGARPLFPSWTRLEGPSPPPLGAMLCSSSVA